MKSQSNTYPERIQQLGINTFAYNYNIQEVDGMYNYETEIFEHYPVRGEIINRIVSNQYPNGEESAILRKAILNPENEEYLKYFEFVENVKKQIGWE